MKKQLGILLLAFIATVGFVVTDQPIVSAVSSGIIINSPGTAVEGGNVNSSTSKDVTNTIESSTNKSTTNIGGNYTGNTVT